MDNTRCTQVRMGNCVSCSLTRKYSAVRGHISFLEIEILLGHGPEDGLVYIEPSGLSLFPIFSQSSSCPTIFRAPGQYLGTHVLSIATYIQRPVSNAFELECVSRPQLFTIVEQYPNADLLEDDNHHDISLPMEKGQAHTSRQSSEKKYRLNSPTTPHESGNAIQTLK